MLKRAPFNGMRGKRDFEERSNEDVYNQVCPFAFDITVASYTSSGAHDLNLGIGLLNWVQQICLQ